MLSFYVVQSIRRRYPDRDVVIWSPREAVFVSMSGLIQDLGRHADPEQLKVDCKRKGREFVYADS